jgi:hypothetical protein
MSGMLKRDYLEMEKIFLNSLSVEQRKGMRKLNPYRTERNSLICKLGKKGVPISLLARTSGLSWIQIFRIVHKGEQSIFSERGMSTMAVKKRKKLRDFEKDDILSKTMEILKCGDKEIVDAFAALIEAQAKICELEKKKSKR